MRAKTEADLMNDVTLMFEQLQPFAQAAFNGLGKGRVSPQIVKFYDGFDQATARSHNPISCKTGCTYCCHYHVMVSATEVFAMVEAIEKLPPHDRDMLKRRVQEVAARTKGMPRDVYLHTNIECAMLREGKCSVYAARPIACRGHHSADVAICKETFEDVHSAAVAPKDYQRELVFRAFDNVQLASNHSAGVDTSKYELHGALSAALTNPATFKRWKSGKAAFPGVTDKATLAEMMASQ